jgi:hypothetical protein
MISFKKVADIFYSDTDKHKKAFDAATLLDNRLENSYTESGMSNIHFDQSAYNAYFDYEKLSQLTNYREKLLNYFKELKHNQK